MNGGVVTYALSIQGGNGTASGFIDSQTGLADVLVKNGNTIEGHVGNANGALAFTISVKPEHRCCHFHRRSRRLRGADRHESVHKYRDLCPRMS
ncbi:MAG: DUF5801 repeats-in-toxin domain-containing protein [Methylovirgula sp.]